MNSNWQECKLGDVGIVVTGKTPSSKSPGDFGHEIPFVTPTDYRNYHKAVSFADRYLSFAGVEKLKNKILPPKSVMVTCIGSDMGKVAINSIPVVTNQQINSIISNSSKVDPGFLYYKLVESYDVLRSYGLAGTAVPIVNKTDFEGVAVLLPPLPEQRAIAGVLSSLDDKIDLLHRQNKTLEGMAEALWRKMFVEDTKNLKIVNLGEIIEIHDSKRIPLSSMQREKMKDGVLYPYYGAATVMDHINQYIFDGEYLLLGEDGTVETDDGYPVLQLATGKFWVNNHTHVLRAKKPFSNFLLYIILRSTNITHIVTGAVQPKINQENLKSLEISSARDITVNELSVVADNFWQKIQANNFHIRTLSRLRDTLLPKLMTGEVRVRL